MSSWSAIPKRVRRRARAGLVDRRDALAVWRARRAIHRIKAGSRTAAIVHLHYAEVWPLLASHLARLEDRDVDIFVTVSSRSSMSLVRERFPAARCIVVPNRGRDVLPFVLVARHLAEIGYCAVLKVHSKKSLHFGGGDQWRDSMLDELLPAEPSVLTAILDALARPETGMVGPRGSYFPLSTYWAGNAATVKRLLAPVVTHDALARLDTPQDLGFFAGAMFWTRLDAIQPLLEARALDFVREPTPKDGTLAHALERAMPVLPELEGRTQYDCDGADVVPRPSTASPLPQWYRSATQAAIAAERSRNSDQK